MMKRRAVFFVLVFALSIFPTLAQKGKTAEIRRIDAYVKTLDALVKKAKAPHLIFADTAEYEENTEPKWQKFTDEKALEKFRAETRETYSIAFNWLKGGKIVRSNFTLFSPSGDWTQYVFHDFRADGTLAHVQSEMRTFNGDLIITQDFYLDQRGRLLKKTVKYSDLVSGKPIKATQKFLETRGNFSNDVEYYKTTDKLPFAKLVK